MKLSFISAFCRLWGQDHFSVGKKKPHPGHSDRHRPVQSEVHCSVHDLTSVDHPYEQIRREMELLYHMGVRILFFRGERPSCGMTGRARCGTWWWRPRKWFLLVNVVTNGTFPH